MVSLSMMLCAACGSAAESSTQFSSGGATQTSNASSGGAAGAAGTTTSTETSSTTTPPSTTDARGGETAETPLANGAGPAPASGAATRAFAMGGDAEHPVARCGPRDSYYFVATEFRCPDGTNPLNGDLRAGQASRVGNVGANRTGHIIDLYEVPCASGAQRVFVDMYGCPEYASMFGGP